MAAKDPTTDFGIADITTFGVISSGQPNRLWPSSAGGARTGDARLRSRASWARPAARQARSNQARWDASRTPCLNSLWPTAINLQYLVVSWKAQVRPSTLIDAVQAIGGCGPATRYLSFKSQEYKLA
jgi:hypothetical protein